MGRVQANWSYGKEMSNLGYPMIPGTFPTITVQGGIILDDPPNLESWSWKKVQSMYDWYVEAVQTEGLPTYGPGATPTVDFISAKTGYPIGDVRLFLFKLKQMTDEGRIDPKWIKQNVKQSAFPTLYNFDKVTNYLKWAGILALTGVGVYISWPFLIKKLKRKR